MNSDTDDHEIRWQNVPWSTVQSEDGRSTSIWLPDLPDYLLIKGENDEPELITFTNLSSETRNRVVEILVSALRHEKATLRTDAAAALGKIGDARAIEPLIAMFAEESKWIRYVAATALGMIGDRRAFEPLLAAFQGGISSESPPFKVWAAWGLGLLGDARAADPLIAALADKEEEVREEVALALGALGDGRAVEALRALLQDESPYVQDAATKALARFEKDK